MWTSPLLLSGSIALSASSILITGIPVFDLDMVERLSD